MKIKTSDLEGHALTWVLLQLEHPDEPFSIIRVEGEVEIWTDRDVGTSHPTFDREGKPRFVRVSDGAWVSLFGCEVDMLNWDECGPIIEREGIELKRGPTKPFVWAAFAFNAPRAHCCGPTPLIAAMRCFVASHLGDEVDVPDSLRTTP